jgi:hypothetical protein
MEISCRTREGFVEKMWRFCVRSIIVEKLWINYGETIENLWNLCVTLMEILCASDGKVMEI